ncbi:universal stress protein [soil metagenome]
MPTNSAPLPPTLGIVVGVDGSPASMAAVQWAARDAQMQELPLSLVCVTPPLVTGSEAAFDVATAEEFTRWQAAQARVLTDRAHELAEKASAPTRAPQISSNVLTAPVMSTLVDLSRRATMMVVGCRGDSAVNRALLGSVSSGLVHHAHCPVAVIHGEEPLSALLSRGPVLVGIDGSATSELATAIAFGEASRRGAELMALHAWSDMGAIGFPPMNWSPIEWRNIKEREEKLLADRLSEWKKRYPDVVVSQRVVCDEPVRRLLESAQAAQLVVLGSHGRGGFAGMLLGSVSTAVVHSARIPVIIARPPEPDPPNAKE